MENFVVSCASVAGAAIGAAVVGTAGSMVEDAIEKNTYPDIVKTTTGQSIGTTGVGGLVGLVVGSYIGKTVTADAVSKFMDSKYMKRS